MLGGIASTSSANCNGSTKLSKSVANLESRLANLEKDLGLNKKYKLHVYDHCPFCIRAELMLGWHDIEYERVVYGYGQGADPAVCGGTGYGPTDGPRKLTGFKMLPVLEGDSLPQYVYDKGFVGLPESLEICAYLMAAHEIHLPCDAGRDDVADWRKKMKPVHSALTRPRNIQMKIDDWKDPRDVAYAQWKYSSKFGFDYAKEMEATPAHIAQMNSYLEELDGLLRGREGTISLNPWGLGMDDIKLLPDLRTLTCVKGLTWPPMVQAYVENAFEKTVADTYFNQAV